MYTKIVLDKPRNFRFGMKAMSFIEKSFGKKITKIDFDDLTIEQTVTVLLAGFEHEDKELTVDKLMDIIDEHSSMDKVMAILAEALTDSFGSSEDEQIKNE